jgi:hypothetical protein
MVVSSMGIGTKNKCDEAQQQFTRPKCSSVMSCESAAAARVGRDVSSLLAVIT